LEFDKENNRFNRVRFKPKTKDASELLTFLQDGLAIKEDTDPPVWLNTGGRAGNVIAFRNKIVDILTGEEIEPSSALWIHHAVGYDWEPLARCPVTEGALAQWFPGDEESPQAVWEQLGLAMTEDLCFEKGLMLIGPPRSGKGCIATIAQALVGTAAYASLDVATWVAKDTSREVLIGKRLGVFEDMRLQPERWFGERRDPGGLGHASVELMLKLTSGNSQTFARKYIGDWTGVTPIKLWIVSNEVPNLNDHVLPSRFVKLAFGQSFLGREDITLKPRLLKELPGIAQKALAAYRAAKAEGRLIQPKAGHALKAEVAANSNPWMAFFEAWLVADPAASVPCWEVFAIFQTWAKASGNSALLKQVPDASKLTVPLRKLPGLAALTTIKPHGTPREYVGLRLKTAAERSPA